MPDITLDLDLYGILEVPATASIPELKKAYKRKALKCHPDKNPDNPKAAQLFQQLIKALEILLNPELRSKYDNLLNAREAAKLRHSALDEKRKKFKEDLEKREQQASSFGSVPPEEKLKNDIERLRKEGEKLIQDEIKRLQEELMRELQSDGTDDITKRQIKVSWTDYPDAETQYSESVLRTIFSKYGDVVAIAFLKNKAIIELADAKFADLAVMIEMGFADNPLKVSYASSKLRKEKNKASASVPKFHTETLSERAERQASERKRLIEEMLKDESDEF